MNGILVTLVYSAVCIGTGLLALRALGLPATPGLDARLPVMSSALILGQALLSATWLLSGLAGWLQPWAIWTVMAALLAVSLPLAAPVLRRAAEQVRAMLGWWTGETVVFRLLATGVVLLAAAFAAAAWLKPPFGDAEAFYMTYARVIAATGRIEPMPGLYATFSSIGMIGEPQLAALIAISGVPAAKLFVWILAAAAAAILHAIGRTAGLGNRGSLLLLAMLFTTTAFTHHIWDGKVDLFAAALGLLAVYWAFAARTTALAKTALAVTGLAAGFAVVAKFSYAISLAPALLVLLLWPREGNMTARARIVVIGLVGLWAIVATVPHLVKNAVMFAAPLAPFIGGAADQNWLQQVWFAPEVIRRIVATYPLALTFGRYPMQGGNLTFLWLAFLPLLWWLPRPARLRDSLLFQLCLAGLAGTLVWMALRPSIIAPRYLLAVLLLFYPLAARAAEHVLDRENAPRWLSGAIAGVTFAALAIFSYPLLPIAADSARQLLGRDTGQCALASTHCPPLLQLNAEAAPGDRVYVLSYYTYWMRDDLLQCRDRGTESKSILLLGGPGLTWNALLNGGFDWLVVDRASHARDYAALFDKTPPDYLNVEIRHQSNDVMVVRLRDRRTAAPRPCRQADGKSWVLATLP